MMQPNQSFINWALQSCNYFSSHPFLRSFPKRNELFWALFLANCSLCCVLANFPVSHFHFPAKLGLSNENFKFFSLKSKGKAVTILTIIMLWSRYIWYWLSQVQVMKGDGIVSVQVFGITLILIIVANISLIRPCWDGVWRLLNPFG